MKIVALCTALFFSGSVYASCDNPIDHVELRQCSEYLYDQLVKEVSATEQLVREKINTWGEEPEYRATSLALFTKVMETHQTYLTDLCEFAASLSAGGNGKHDLRVECKINSSSNYLEYLRIRVSALD